MMCSVHDLYVQSNEKCWKCLETELAALKRERDELSQELVREKVTSDSLLTAVNQANNVRDSLAAENRVILTLVEGSHGLFRDACGIASDAFKRGLSAEEGGNIMRDAVESRIESFNQILKSLSASRELERVKALEAVAEAAHTLMIALATQIGHLDEEKYLSEALEKVEAK